MSTQCQDIHAKSSEFLSTRRLQEIARYELCYKRPNYRMGRKRVRKCMEVLSELEPGLWLDVGAGRGEFENLCDQFKHSYQGIEPVPYLASKNVVTGIATRLPFGDGIFDYVACLDVLEHLIPEDVGPSLEEMKRVGNGVYLLMASDSPAMGNSPDGKDLHISKRPKHKWEALFREILGDGEYTYLGRCGPSPGWLIRT